MAYDEGLAQRIRELLEERPGFIEKTMFGGIAFMVHGNMACGVINENLIVRVGPKRFEGALAQPSTKVFDFTGRPMKGWVMVDTGGYTADGDLESWVQQGVDFALSLPPK